MNLVLESLSPGRGMLGSLQPGMPAMSLGTDGTRPVSSIVLETLHQSRRRQALQVLADNQHLLATAEELRLMPLRPDASPARRDPDDNRLIPRHFGTLLGTLAIVLIALHAICAAVILDRALAAAPASVWSSLAD